MYKIGDFSKLTGASVKTLRFYDSIDLLKPTTIDNYTNYRYYGENELEQYKRIKQLQNLGFTLEEIKQNLEHLSIKCLDIKKQELLYKIDYMMNQVIEIEKLKDDLNEKVKVLKN